MCCTSSLLCLILCDPMDCSLPGSSVHGDSPGKNTGVGCHGLLQGLFPTQGSNPGLPHCMWILYCLSHGKPKNTGVGNLYLFQGIFPIQELNRDLLHCRRILYQLSYHGSPLMLINNSLVNAIIKSYYGEGNGTPLQYSCLKNPMDGGAW